VVAKAKPLEQTVYSSPIARPVARPTNKSPKHPLIDVLQAFFSDRKVQIHVTGVKVGFRTLIFGLEGQTANIKALLPEVEQALATYFFTKHPDYKDPEYCPTITNGLFHGQMSLFMDKFPTDVKPVLLSEIFSRTVKEMQALKTTSPAILLGLRADGRLILFNLKDAQHIARQGVSGSGKGNAYFQLFPTLLLTSPKDLKLMVCDFKKDVAGVFSSVVIPHCVENGHRMIATERQDIYTLFLNVQKLIKGRHEKIANAGVNNIFGLMHNEGKRYPLIVVIVTELSQLFNPEMHPESKEIIKKIQDVLDNMLAFARSAGVYFHLDSQKITQETTCKNISQINTRVSFKFSGSPSPFLGVGKNDAPVHKLAVAGDFYMMMPDKQLVKGHTALMDNDKKQHIPFLELIQKRWK
jgi:hypothetical protein